MQGSAGFLSWVLGVVSRALVVRDWMAGVGRGIRRSEACEEFWFASGARRLKGFWVPGEAGGPVLLICHGIGDLAWHWSEVQVWLAERGVGSMVFDYSGYGKSSGRVRVSQYGEDVVSAYAEVRRRVGEDARVFVMGFSLGSGVVAESVGALRPVAAGLFLGGAYTSFREAACSIGCPRFLTRLVPDVWKTEACVAELEMPVCVVYSGEDWMFPVTMGRRIAEACGGELVVVDGFGHNEPYRRVTEAYWGVVVERMVEGAGLNAGISPLRSR